MYLLYCYLDFSDNKFFCLVVNKFFKYKIIIFYIILFFCINKLVKGNFVYFFKLFC